MAVEVQAIVNSEAFRRAFARAPEEMFVALRKGFSDSLRHFQSRVSTERLRGRPGLKRPTGNLVRSQQITISGTTIANLVGLYSIGGLAAPYARIHEYGGEIRPVRAKYLTIPIGPALNPGGSARGTARDFDLKITVRNGKLFLADEEGRLFFLLVKSVKIPPRIGLFQLWRDDQGARERLLKSAVDRALEKVAARSRGAP